MPIHPTAVIDPKAQVPNSCDIGPYCILGSEVELGEKCRLVSHVHIDGPTRIGYRFEESSTGRTKVRICRKCGADLPKRGRGES